MWLWEHLRRNHKRAVCKEEGQAEPPAERWLGRQSLPFPLQHVVQVAECLLFFKILFRALLTVGQGRILPPCSTEGIFSNSFQQNSSNNTQQRNTHAKKKSVSLVPHTDLQKNLRATCCHIYLVSLCKANKFHQLQYSVVYHCPTPPSRVSEAREAGLT